MYVRASASVDLNKNTEWFTYPGVWTTYILILFFSWFLVLSVFACQPGTAWTFVHLAHSLFYAFKLLWRRANLYNAQVRPYWLYSLLQGEYLIGTRKTEITYQCFHWKKGTPFSDDQGIYNRLTWWEQVDNGNQLTRNRKFLTVVPIILYLIASHTTDYQHPMLFFNTLAVFVLVVAKFPHMHKVRIFGINADQ